MDMKQIAQDLTKENGWIDHFMDGVEPVAYGTTHEQIEQILRDFALFLSEG